MNDNLIIAQRNINSAIHLLNSNDESQLNMSCFCIEQAIELCFKFMLRRKQKDIGKKHDIPSNVYHIKQSGYIIDDWFYSHAADLKSWAVESRYNIDVKATWDTCKMAVEKTEELLKDCKEIEVQDSLENSSNFDEV